MRQSGDPVSVGTRTELEFDVGGETSTATVIAWANYIHSDTLNVQLGRYITPQGIIHIEHFPATLLDPEQPKFLRPFGGDTIFANFENSGVKITRKPGPMAYAADTTSHREVIAFIEYPDGYKIELIAAPAS